MEKENAKLRGKQFEYLIHIIFITRLLFVARQEETAVKRIKLEYDEMKYLGGAEMEVWDLITNKDSSKIKCDKKMLLHAVKQGSLKYRPI